MIIHKDFNLTTQFFYSSSPKIVSLKVIEVDEDMNLFLGEKKLLFDQGVAFLSYLTKMSVPGTWKSLPLMGSLRYFSVSPLISCSKSPSLLLLPAGLHPNIMSMSNRAVLVKPWVQMSLRGQLCRPVHCSHHSGSLYDGSMPAQVLPADLGSHEHSSIGPLSFGKCLPDLRADTNEIAKRWC